MLNLPRGWWGAA